jgi:hypothetical protein
MNRSLRIAGALVGAAGLSLVLAACGSGGSPGVASITTTTSRGGGAPSTTSSSANPLLVAGRCLRHHGLANLPDPAVATSGPDAGQTYLDKQALVTFSQAEVQRALSACASQLAAAGFDRGASSVPTPQVIQDGLNFARCVRRHGLSNLPDPNAQGHFNLSGTGINPNDLTSRQLAIARVCLPAAHGTIHIPTQGGGPTGSSP